MFPETEKREETIRKARARLFIDPPVVSDGSHLVRKWSADFAALSDLWWNQLILSAKNVTPEQMVGLERRVAEFVLSRRAILPIYLANFVFDFTAAIRSIKAPTMIIEQVEEQWELQGPRLVKIMPNAQTVAIRGQAGGDAAIAKIIKEFVG